MTLWKNVLLSSALFLGTRLVQPQTDAQSVTLMQHRALLACVDYSTDRAKPGISGVPVDALRVLLKHKYLVCPVSSYLWTDGGRVIPKSRGSVMESCKPGVRSRTRSHCGQVDADGRLSSGDHCLG